MNEETIFTEATRRADPAERAAFLEAACGGDDALRRRVEALLSAHEAGGSFLEPLVSAPPSPAESEAPPAPGEGVASEPPGHGPLPVTQADTAAIVEGPEEGTATDPFGAPSRPRSPSGEDASGTVIGPYKLLEPIGEGGMGTVYMAEQTAPVRRLVALKLIKPGMDSRQVIARFEAERQALALMDHPNIAKVLDAGATEQGRPFFVMELVKGVPITQFCDERRLTPRERLELFLPVCQAVQHAHQKGIIHRDLKPSNVLIALYDGKPVPKVIDFGVAKATGQKLTEATLFTGFGAVVGTPEYMSPEQAELNQLDIDTRSDVYSLGALLYELVTGTTPLDRKRLKQAAVLEVLRVIREEEPPRPSTRLSTTEELPSIAARRNVEPRKLSGLVRGELDWIVMKALEKDRNRRYETASDLAADLRRHLDDEQVLACPPSAGYRLRKLARRNRGLLATAAAVLLALVAGTAVATWQAVRARKAESLAERRLEAETAARKEADANLQKAREAVDKMLTRVGDERLRAVPQAEEIRKQLLEDALEFYEGFLKQQPRSPEAMLDRAEALTRVARVQGELGQFRDAEVTYRAANEQYEGVFTAMGRDDPDIRLKQAWSTNWRGYYLQLNGQFDSADVELRRALDLATHVPPEGTRGESARRLAGECEKLIGSILRNRGRYQEAIPHLRKALDLYEPIVTRHPDDFWLPFNIAWCWLDLASTLCRSGRPAEAEPPIQQALRHVEGLSRRHAEDPAVRAVHGAVFHHLAEVQLKQDQTIEALRTIEEVLEVFGQLAAEYPGVWAYREVLAQAWERQAQAFRNAPEQERERVVSTLRDLIQKRSSGSAELASSAGRESLARLRLHLGTLLVAGARRDEGISILQAALHDYERLINEEPTELRHRYQYSNAFKQLMEALFYQGKIRESAEVARGWLLATERNIRDFPKETGFREQLPHNYRYLAFRLGGLGDRSGARTAFQDSTRVCLELGPDNGFWLHCAADNHLQIGRAFERERRTQEASSSYRAALDLWIRIVEEGVSVGGWGEGEPYRGLASVLPKVGRGEDARRLLKVGRTPAVNDQARLGITLGQYYEALGACLASAGDEPAARTATERSRTLILNAVRLAARQPGQNPVELNDSVWNLLRFGATSELAVECAAAMQKAVEVQPRSWFLWNTLGVARYRAGDWTGAIAALEQSRAINGDRILAHDGFFLAMAHHQIGHATEARDWFDRSVAWMDQKAPNDEELLRFRAEAADLLMITESGMPNGEEAFARGS